MNTLTNIPQVKEAIKQTPLEKFHSSSNRDKFIVDESDPLDLVYHHQVNKLFDSGEKEKAFDFNDLYGFPSHYLHGGLFESFKTAVS